jgi:hypothetical protein
MLYARAGITSIMFLDIIHRLVHLKKHNVSEIGFCLRNVVFFLNGQDDG